MRAEAISPRTWLLAALAGWSLLVLLLALFGLGGRIVPLPADPALAQALPRLPAPAPERLGPLSQYADISARPLFSENRKPQPFVLSGEGEATPQTFDFVLSSVLITPQLRLAILQPTAGGEGLRVKEGEAPQSAPGWRLVELEARSAVFEGPEGRRTLELRLFDGTGGAPPTAMTVVPSPRPPGEPGRVTGGTVPPVPVPVPAAQAVENPPAPAGAEGMPAASAPPATTEEQMDAIRKRIEARREQMRRQNESPTTPPAVPGKTQ
jgi:general secretion pathway protein N